MARPMNSYELARTKAGGVRLPMGHWCAIKKMVPRLYPTVNEAIVNMLTYAISAHEVYGHKKFEADLAWRHYDAKRREAEANGPTPDPQRPEEGPRRDTPEEKPQEVRDPEPEGHERPS